MKLKVPFFLFFTILSFNLFSQTSIEVSDNTIKISAFGDETLYYGFAEGDQLIFNFEEVNGKDLKEVEITEMPSSSKFMDYKTKKIENKTIMINRTGIYKFRFSNSAVGGRICRIKIHRIPASAETAKFNSSVFWRTVYDTTYIPREENYIIKSDTSAIVVTDQTSKISSSNALNGNPNKTIVDFVLPNGTVTWSYYIGVGTEGKEAFDNARSDFVQNAAYKVASIPGYGPMAALAMVGHNIFQKAQGGDNVKYWFITNWESVQAFKNNQAFYQYKQGDILNDASRMTSPRQGRIFLGLMNDNMVDPIDVIVKVTAIVVKQDIGNKVVQDMNVSKHEEAYLKN